MSGIVCLHGWGMNKQVWQALQATNSDPTRLILVDLPGYGCTAPEPYDFTQLLDAIVSQVKQECVYRKMAGPLTWVGWSFGGLLALLISLRFPELIQRLILLGTNPKFIATNNWPGMPQQDCQTLYNDLTSAPHKALQRFLALQCKAPQGINKQAYQQIMQTRVLESKPTPEVLQASLQLLMQADLRDVLPQVKPRVQWVFAADDALVPVTVADNIAECTTHSITIIPGTHWDLLNPIHLHAFIEETADAA